MQYKLVSHREVAAKLKVARLEKGWTGVQAGEVCGLAQPQISKVENGQQQFFTMALRAKVQTLADALGVAGLRWDDATDAELDREAEAVARAEVETDDKRERRERIYNFFVNDSKLKTHHRVGMVVDLYKEGVFTPEQALDAIDTVCMDAEQHA